MEHEKILVTKSVLPPMEEYMKEISSLWESRWLTNMGEKHQNLEEGLKRYLETPLLKLFTNGHLALEMVIEALGLEGEVITTPFTFASTTHALVRQGLKPVFVDIRSEDFTMDVDACERAITKETTAIMPVHVYGNICQVEALEELARKHGLKIIYDAAHCFGVKYQGRGIATFGDASMFSFHATKVFHTIEGGAVSFQDPEMGRILDALKNFGFAEGVPEFTGGNAKMNEFQAAMGICNLKYLDAQIAKRRILSERYAELLQGVKGIRLPKNQEEVEKNYAYFPVVFDGFHKNRDQVLADLAKNNIFARKYFYPLTSSFACYEGKFAVQNTPIAEHIAERVITLPLYPELSLAEVDRIVSIIHS